MSEKTKELLIKHCDTYPVLQPQDIFKYIFHSSFGCEHLATDEKAVLEYIVREYETVSKDAPPFTEHLDGDYSRAYLSWLNDGLRSETLAKIFCLSAKNEPDGKTQLSQKLEIAKKLTAEGKLPFDEEEFAKSLDEWCDNGCPAVHHSDIFRNEYKPSYRVIANKYAYFLLGIK